MTKTKTWGEGNKIMRGLVFLIGRFNLCLINNAYWYNLTADWVDHNFENPQEPGVVHGPD